MPEVLERSARADDQRDEVQDVRSSDPLRDSDIPAEGFGPDDAAPREVIEALRQRYIKLAKRSLYFLCKAVLGFTDMTLRTHWEFAKFIQDLSNRRTLDLMPRSTFKTSIGTIGFVIWLLIHNPNLFILLANQTAGNAERMLLEIESHLDGSNPIIAWLFPEMIRPNPRWKFWSANKMTLPNRTVASGTPTVMAIGVGGKAESLHFHVIIKDDLIGRAAMMSRLEMQDAIAWNDYSESLFVNPSHDYERIHGTRWAIDDLYSILIDDPNYEVFIRKAVQDDGSLFFPERLDEETLRKIRENNFLVFMSQYQNDPSSPENLDFRKEWLQYYEMGYEHDTGEYFCRLAGQDFYLRDMVIHLIVDPASSGDLDLKVQEAMKHGRVQRANNAVVILGAHPSGRWFILDLWAGRAVGKNPELQVAEKILEMAQRWRGYVRKGWIEAFGAEGAIITVFNMMCEQRGTHFLLEKIPRGQVRAKPVRIRGAIGPIAGAGLLCCRAIHDQFILEFGQFPQSSTFDTLDAVAWGIIQVPAPATEARKAAIREEHQHVRRLRMRYVGRAGY